MTAVMASNAAVVTLPSDTEVQITRVFDAPRDLVYRAWTTPDLIRRWWAGDRGEVTSVEVDLRVGGSWRYVMRANAGFEFAFRGEYVEIEPGERIVSTEEFEGAPGVKATSITTLTEQDGSTTLTILVQHASRQNRDAQVNSGMDTGLESSLAKLEQVANSLR
jgi:uncharacterized protein YndB with AHSA1/START domain